MARKLPGNVFLEVGLHWLIEVSEELLPDDSIRMHLNFV